MNSSIAQKGCSSNFSLAKKPEYSTTLFHQRIMKCDADVHEVMFTYIVLSGDTTMFQDIDERMPTTSAPEVMQIKVHLTTGAKPLDVASPSVAQACEGAPREHSPGYYFPDASGRSKGLRSGSRCNKSDRCSCAESRQDE